MISETTKVPCLAIAATTRLQASKEAILGTRTAAVAPLTNI